MTYDEAISYIHSINWTFCKPGLERIAELCHKLGDPQNELSFIHVAGTNGKGSFCAMLESVLRESGYKTGLFTSPYVKEFNERIRYCGVNISDDELSEITEYVKPYADSMEDKPTEFELITAIGFEFFKRHKCDVVVLEAGMGGRLDSTNIISTSVLSVITGISLEHTAFLGNTVKEIAREKAGIIKPGIPVIFGGESEACSVIEEIANERNAKFTLVDKSLINNVSSSLCGTRFDFMNRNKLEISLLGLYQPHNAANVITAIDELKNIGFGISEKSIYEGLKKASWPARFEIIKKDPLVIFDGAHNPEGIEVAIRSIKHYFGDKRVVLLTGVMKDKNYNYIADKLSMIADSVYTVTPDNSRAFDAHEYAEVFSSRGILAQAADSIEMGLSLATKRAEEKDTALVCLGSLYMYKEISEKI